MADANSKHQPDTPPPTPPPHDKDSSTAGRSMTSRQNSESLVRKAVQQQQSESNAPERRIESSRPSEADTGCIYSQRAFKKSSQNGKLTLYLASRDLVVSGGKIDKLQGVLLIDPEILQDKKVYGQVTLTFRYGREDEEVMGLKFCNEAIMSLAQLYPPYHPSDRQEATTPFQEVLVKRFHPNAHPFTMAVTPLAPPSVQLVPAKEYNGAPIGTSYDIRIYAAERPDEKLTRKMQYVKMGIRVIQGPHLLPPPTRSLSVGGDAAKPPPPQREKSVADENEIKADEEPAIPHAAVEKQFLLSDGRVRLEASLDKAVYDHGDLITVHVNVTNNSNKSVKRIEADIVQHVDVCMFSNGKFKNIVAQLSSRDGCPVEPGFTLARTFGLRPEKGTTKNWIALEDDPGGAKGSGNLASSVICAGNAPEDRNVFAIYVSYYVKVKIVVSPIGEWIGGVVSLKLPFTLVHSPCELETQMTMPTSPPTSTTQHVGTCRILDKIETVDDPNEDSLPYIDKDNTSDEDQNELESEVADDDSGENGSKTVTAVVNGDGTGTTTNMSPPPTTVSSPLGKSGTTTTTQPILETTTTTTTTTTLTTTTTMSTSSSPPTKDKRDSLSNADLIERCCEDDSAGKST